MSKFFRNNGLSVTLAALFLAFWLGQAIAGWSVFNTDQVQHGTATVGFAAYLTSAHFVEATAENWESEFLQMGAYVALTVFLFQKGSAESKSPDAPESEEQPTTAQSPWPAKRGGWVRTLYSYSLSLAFAILFLASFTAHAVSGYRLENEELISHGQPAEGFLEFLSGSQFWFEAFQNWQSEFLAVLSIAVLSIFLRQKGSPESKPVDMPNSENP